MSVSDYSYGSRTDEMKKARQQRAREIAIEAVSRMTDGVSLGNINGVLASADVIARYITSGTIPR